MTALQCKERRFFQADRDGGVAGGVLGEEELGVVVHDPSGDVGIAGVDRRVQYRQTCGKVNRGMMVTEGSKG